MDARPVPLRRNRDFVALWFGDLVSSIGSGMSLVAFPLLVLGFTGSAAKAGLVGFAQTVPILLVYLPAGVLLDRHDRRAAMAVSAAIGALALGSLAVAIAAGALTFGHVVAVAFVDGAAGAVFRLAEQGALPLVVARDQVTEAVARNEIRRTGADLAGPPLGGLLFGAGRVLPFLADALSSLIALVAVLLVRRPLQEPRAERGPGMAAELREGVRWLWATPFIRSTALAVSAGNLVWAGLELALIVRAREHGASAGAIGVMFALLALGGLAGALAAPGLCRRLPSAVIVIGAFWAEAAGVAALTLTRDPYLLGLIAAAASFPAPAWNAVVVGARLTMTPDRLRSRVTAVARLLSGAMVPVGALATGLLIAARGTTFTLLTLAGWQAAVAAASTAAPSLRRGRPPG